jgi:hypothetical protein
MPKLIIPNAHELYKPEGKQFSQEDGVARQFYNSRFLWLLDPGDVIVLPELPAKGFMNYLADLKQIDLQSVTIVTWNKPLEAEFSDVLVDEDLVKRLKSAMAPDKSWSIQTCYFNQAVSNLADRLNIPLDAKWRRLIKNDFVRQLNSKVEFRRIAASYNLPIAKGNVCTSAEMLAQAIESLIILTGQAIVKQDHNGGGRGNIGITVAKSSEFAGVIDTVVMDSNKSAVDVANQIWQQNIDDLNNQLIVEAYYPNTGTFTTMLWIPPAGNAPILLNYSEIRMETIWVGVQIPAVTLRQNEVDELKSASMKFATILQDLGYYGYACCDAIRTISDGMLFTEINVRPGAETHAQVLASQLFGLDYAKQATILTRRGLTIPASFEQTKKLLEENDLLLTHKRSSGVALLTVEDKYSKQVESFVAAPDTDSAYALERRLLSLLSE